MRASRGGPTSSLTDRTDGRAVQRAPTAATRVRRYALPIEQVRPLVRIAHRVAGPIHIARRVIVDFEIVLVTRGQTLFITEGPPALLRAGSLVLIPPFIGHAFQTPADPAAEQIGVHFDLSPAVPGTAAAARSAAYRVELSHGQSLPTCMPIPAGSMVRGAIERVVDAFAERSPAAELECSSLLAVVLARLMAGAARPADTDPHRWRLQKLMAFIDAHLADPLDAEALAAQMDLSPSRFRAVFGRLMGVSPHQYVTHRRIERARTLLAGDAHTIKQIARLTGFADEFHFSKTFRHVDGLPPSVYRTQARASRI